MIFSIFNPEKGTWVLVSFIAFFAVIVAVNTVYITSALYTHSGVITDKPYEKGLAYDALLENARAQPDIDQSAAFEDGVLRWIVKAPDGAPLEGVRASARLVWPVKRGYDFDVDLKPAGDGVFEAVLDLPKQGRWKAQLIAQWQMQHYQTQFSFIAK